MDWKFEKRSLIAGKKRLDTKEDYQSRRMRIKRQIKPLYLAERIPDLSTEQY